jgi:hypothetical protein
MQVQRKRFVLQLARKLQRATVCFIVVKIQLLSCGESGLPWTSTLIVNKKEFIHTPILFFVKKNMDFKRTAGFICTVKLLQLQNCYFFLSAISSTGRWKQSSLQPLPARFARFACGW